MKWLGSKPTAMQTQAMQEQKRLAKEQLLRKAFPDKFDKPQQGVTSHGHRRASQKIHWSTAQTSNTWNPGAFFTWPTGSSPEERAERSAATPHEGIRAGEITGWRAWRLFRGDLYSTVTDFRWNDGPLEAKASDIANGYGFFAFRDRGHAQVQAELEFMIWGLDWVFGSVDMWGEIVEHDMGYRSSHAAIRTIESVCKQTSRWALFASDNRFKAVPEASEAQILEQLRAKYIKPEGE